ncbi:MAG: APC family permease [Actinobacteria bacterium]|nr:APC family permease [Actinomycetota bacterium]
MSTVEGQPGTDPAVAAGSGPRLRANSMGWIAAAAIGAIIMSPAGGIYFNFGPMVQKAGAVEPFIFLIALIASLPTALSFAMVAREMPSAGSVYTWIWNATRPSAGLFVGWILAGFYLLAMIVLPGIFALFWNEFLNFFGVSTGYGTWAAGVILTTLVVIAVNYTGITITVKATIIFMVFESAVLLALALTVFAKGGYAGHISAAPFNPATAVGGGTAIFGALIFGIQSNVGYDAIPTLAEETRTPKKFIPLATIAAVISVGIYWIVVSWAFSEAAPVKEINNLLSQGFTPIVPIAKQYWSSGDIIIIISAMTSITGIYIAQTVGTSRVLYAMGREGSIPPVLGRLNRRYGLPWNAMTVGIIATTIVTLILGKTLGLANQYGWTGTMSSFLGLLTYFCVNAANIIFFLRYRREKFNILLNGVVPVVGIAVVLYILYKSYFASLWDAGWTYGRSVQIAVIAWLVLGVAWTLFLKRRKPDLFRRRSQVFDPDAPAGSIAPDAAAPGAAGNA